jgi:hypothetical protein
MLRTFTPRVAEEEKGVGIVTCEGVCEPLCEKLAGSLLYLSDTLIIDRFLRTSVARVTCVGQVGRDSQ